MDDLRTISVELKTKRDAARFEAMVGETLLFAGLRSGLDLPYECASGACGSCQAQIVSGGTTAIRNMFPGAPAAKDLGPDRVLMCQTACHGDVELRLFSRLTSVSDRQIRPQYLSGAVDSVDRVARNTYTLSVSTVAPIPYQAGQFVMLSVDGVPGWRAYSMTAAPRRRGPLEFVIRTKPGGGFSEWLCNAAHRNVPVRVFGPLGRAVLPEPPGNLVAVAGGTGIAGILSILEEALLSNYLSTGTATLVFGVRTLADAFFLDRLSEWVRIAEGHLAVVVAVSEGDLNGAARYPGLNFASGLVLDVAHKRLAKGPHADTCFFLAGPPAVVDGGLAILCGSFGVQRSHIRFDRFH